MSSGIKTIPRPQEFYRGWTTPLLFLIHGSATVLTRRENNEIAKILWWNLKIFFSRTYMGQFHATELDTKHPCMVEGNLSVSKRPFNSPKGENVLHLLFNFKFSHITLCKRSYWLELCFRWAMWPMGLLLWILAWFLMQNYGSRMVPGKKNILSSGRHWIILQPPFNFSGGRHLNIVSYMKPKLLIL